MSNPVGSFKGKAEMRIPTPTPLRGGE